MRTSRWQAVPAPSDPLRSRNGQLQRLEASLIRQRDGSRSRNHVPQALALPRSADASSGDGRRSRTDSGLGWSSVVIGEAPRKRCLISPFDAADVGSWLTPGDVPEGVVFEEEPSSERQDAHAHLGMRGRRHRCWMPGPRQRDRRSQGTLGTTPVPDHFEAGAPATSTSLFFFSKKAEGTSGALLVLGAE